MDWILLALAIALLALNWGIYTRLTDSHVLSKNLQLQVTGSGQERYLSKMFRNLISTASVFAVVIVVILIFLPIMYNMGRGWIRLSYLFTFFFTLAVLTTFAEMFLIQARGKFRLELLVRRAKIFNVLSAVFACGFLFNVF